MKLRLSESNCTARPTTSAAIRCRTPRPNSVGNTPNEVFEGTGHEIQIAGRPVNEALLAMWRTIASGSASPSSTSLA